MRSILVYVWSTVQTGKGAPGVQWKAESAHLEVFRVGVRGSYSARVPRSSLAEVHREFAHHIVEEEVDGQEEKQDDWREDRQHEEESGKVAENQPPSVAADCYQL